MPRRNTTLPSEDVHSPGLLRQLLLDILASEIHSHNMTNGRVTDFRRKNESLRSTVWQAEQTVTVLPQQLTSRDRQKVVNTRVFEPLFKAIE